MGWTIPWLTTTDDFAKDFGVELWAGLNGFLREGDQVFRTYFINGEEMVPLGSIWSLLDLTPFGRQETWEDSPDGWPQTEPHGWRLHDEYGATETASG